MHELSIATAVLDTVRRHSDGRRVTAVTLRTGRLRQVVPDSLDFYWGILTREAEDVEGARLEQVAVPAMLRCNCCERVWELGFPVFRCPGCETVDVEVISGEELEVESIEVEDPCIAPG